jgi:HlyD family secretion protein
MRQHELVSAEAALQSAREDLERTVIKAPISGIVAQLFAKQGEVVITGTMNNPGTRIMVITDLSQMQVRCRVDEADAPLVERGQPARIYLQSDTRRSIAGHVLRVGTKGTKPLGRDVVTFETLVLITGEDERVKPGMTANVEIEVAREADALVIPVESVVYRRRRDLPEKLVAEYDAQQVAQGVDPENVAATAKYIRVVFCVTDLKAQPRLITTGINDATGVEVTDGLTDGETVVIGPYRSLDQLKDGSAVKIQEKKKSGEDAPTTQPTTDESSAPATPDEDAA